MPSTFDNIALIGLGEVGRRMASDLLAAGVRQLNAWDIAFADPASQQYAAAKALDVRIASSAADATTAAGLIVSAVTAGSALDAAKSTAPHCANAAFFLDVNSVAPSTKQAAAAVIEAAGGRYVEAAVMSPFPPKGIATPMLLGGPHAAQFLERAAPLGFNARVYSDQIGAASSVKMCRSIMIKGIESLVAECTLASREYGVLDDVLASLKDLFPGQDWRKTAGYMLNRTLEHGVRRAEEMREVAKTVADAGLDPLMSSATAQRQDWAGALGSKIEPATCATADLDILLKALREAGAVAPTGKTRT